MSTGFSWMGRGGWSTSMDGLRFHQPTLLRTTFLLLAAGRIPEGEQDGSVDKAFADASGFEKRPSRMAGQSLYATETDFVFPSVRNKGKEATRPRRGAEPNNLAGVR